MAPAAFDWTVAALVASNIFFSIGVILANKHLFQDLAFKYSTWKGTRLPMDRAKEGVKEGRPGNERVTKSERERKRCWATSAKGRSERERKGR